MQKSLEEKLPDLKRKADRMGAEDRALLAYRAAVDRKAIDLAVLDLKELSSITDIFLFCSGQNARQMQAIAEAIDERLSEHHVEPLSREGIGGGSWILLDYDDLVVHIFSEETRKFYNLERLWARAPRLKKLAGENLTDMRDEADLGPTASQTESAQ
jgi:ribosome-associated protein